MLLARSHDKNRSEITKCQIQTSDYVDRFISSLIDVLPPAYLPNLNTTSSNKIELVQLAK